MEPITTAVLLKWALGGLTIGMAAVCVCDIWFGLSNLIEKIIKKKLPEKISKFTSKIKKYVAEVEPIVNPAHRLVSVLVWAHDMSGKIAKLNDKGDTISYDSADYETKQHLDSGKGFVATFNQ